MTSRFGGRYSSEPRLHTLVRQQPSPPGRSHWPWDGNCLWLMAMATVIERPFNYKRVVSAMCLLHCCA
jgi:hypothetical protein